MFHEPDVSLIWRKLIGGQAITSDQLAEADTMIEGLSPENPLRQRLSKELDEIRALRQQDQGGTSNSSPNRNGHGTRQKHGGQAKPRDGKETKGRRKASAAQQEKESG